MTHAPADLCRTIGIRGNEVYIWRWLPSRGAEVIRSASRFAADPELAFTWDDAAEVAMKVWEQAARNGEN